MKLSKALNFLSCGLLFPSKNSDSSTRASGSLTTEAHGNPPSFKKADLENKTNAALASLFINSGELTPENLKQFASALAKNIKADVTSDSTASKMTALVANFKTAYEAQTPDKTTSFKLEQTSSVASLLRNVAEMAHETKPLQKLTGYIDRNANKLFKFGLVGGAATGAVVGCITMAIVVTPLAGNVGLALGALCGAAGGFLATLGLMAVSNLTRMAVKDKATEQTQKTTKEAFETNFRETIQKLEKEALAEKHQLENQALQAQHNATAPDMLPV